MSNAFKQYKPEDVYITILTPKPTDGESATDQERDTAQYHLTGSEFLDAFIRNMHRYQFQCLPFYAGRLGVDVRDLSSTIRVLTGLPPNEWRDRYVTLAACELLLKTNWSVSAIGKRLGFSCIAVFSRHFRAQTRLRPTEWRYRYKV